MSETTGNRLKKVSDALFDGNQSEMARMMGMSPQAMNKYFQGDRTPGFKILKRLASLDINLNWIVNGIPPMRISEIKEAGVVKFDISTEPGEDYKQGNQKKGADGSSPGNDFFSHINESDLSQTERSLLAEVKQFSDSLKSLNLPLQVKRLMLELMIEHIGQEIERLQSTDP